MNVNSEKGCRNLKCSSSALTPVVNAIPTLPKSLTDLKKNLCATVHSDLLSLSTTEKALAAAKEEVEKLQQELAAERAGREEDAKASTEKLGKLLAQLAQERARADAAEAAAVLAQLSQKRESADRTESAAAPVPGKDAKAAGATSNQATTLQPKQNPLWPLAQVPQAAAKARSVARGGRF